MMVGGRVSRVCRERSLVAGFRFRQSALKSQGLSQAVERARQIRRSCTARRQSVSASANLAGRVSQSICPRFDSASTLSGSAASTACSSAMASSSRPSSCKAFPRFTRAALNLGFNWNAVRNAVSASPGRRVSAASKPRLFQVWARAGSSSAATFKCSRACSSCLTVRSASPRFARSRALRAPAQRRAEKLHGLGRPALLEDKHAQPLERRNRLRVAREDLAVPPFSKCRLAADMAALCILEDVVDAHRESVRKSLDTNGVRRPALALAPITPCERDRRA